MSKASVAIGYGLAKKGRVYLTTIRATSAQVRRNASRSQWKRSWPRMLADGFHVVKVYVLRTEQI